MKWPLLAILALHFSFQSCHTARRVGGAMASGAGYVGHGAKKLGGSAARLWPWRTGTPKPDPAPAAGSGDPAPAVKPVVPTPFPANGLLVAESELGDDATRLQATSVNIPGGWEIKGASIAYHLDADGSSPRILKATGTPATATSVNGDIASARAIHYRLRSGVLVLTGDPVLKTGGQTIRSRGGNTTIKIHVPTGAMTVDGPASYE